MDKVQATALRKQINQNKRYPTYYSSKTGKMSVRVYTYINNEYSEPAEKNAINKLLSLVTWEKYSIKHRTYQGFIHDTDIIFE